VGVTVGLSHWRKNTGCYGCSITGNWEGIGVLLGPTGWKWRVIGGGGAGNGGEHHGLWWHQMLFERWQSAAVVIGPSAVMMMMMTMMIFQHCRHTGQSQHSPHTDCIALHVSTRVQNLHQEENPNETLPSKTPCILSACLCPYWQLNCHTEENTYRAMNCQFQTVCTTAACTNVLHNSYYRCAALTLILLTRRIGRGPNNARKWQMEFNLAFEELKWVRPCRTVTAHQRRWPQEVVSACCSRHTVCLYCCQSVVMLAALIATTGNSRCKTKLSN